MTSWAGPPDDPDRYQLHQLQSRGAEGELWRATVQVDGADVPVALKLLHHPPGGDISEQRLRWQRQAELLRTLDHPNVVTVRDVFAGPAPHDRGRADQSTSSLYLAMNWVEGESAAEWVARNPHRDVLDSIRIVARVADGLDYLHSGTATSRPVLHRDIKPANVVVAGGNVRLVDFGLARVLSDEPVTIAGTPAYLAPEVLGGQPHTEAADRFSLGAMAFHLLVGRAPDLTDREEMAASLREIDGMGGRSDLAEHVLAMMDPDPSRRPASSVAWARALTASAVSGSGTTLPSMSAAGAGDEGTPPARRRGRAGLIAATVAVVLIGATAGAFAAGVFDRGETMDPIEVAAAEEPEEAPSTEEPTTEPDPETEADAEPEPDSVQMPDLVGLSVDAARSQLQEFALGPVTVVEEFSPEPPGTVLASDPRPDQRADGEVTLTVAARPDEVPNVTGMTQTDGVRTLSELGIEVTVVQELDPTSDDRSIIAQRPQGGSPYQPQAELTVATKGAARFLADLETAEGRHPTTGSVDLNGETYTRSISYSFGWDEAQQVGYNLGRRYRRFQAVAGVTDDSPSASRVRVEVFGDGNELHRVDLSLGESSAIDVDVSGVLRLELVLTSLDDSWEAREAVAAFGEARLVGLPDEIPDLDDDQDGW